MIVEPLGCRFFGTLTVERSGETIDIGTKKAEALFAFLCLNPGVHSRERLAGMLWADSTDEKGRNSLRVELSRARKSLGDLFLAERETLQLNPQAVISVDAIAFQQIIDKPGASIEELQAACALYRGELLTDLYEDWVLPLRQELLELYLAAEIQLAQRLHSRGDHTQALAHARRAIVREPSNERAHQMVMRILIDSGDRSAALHQFETLTKELQDDLGVAPSSESKALAAQARAATGQQAAPQANIAATSSPAAKQSQPTRSNLPTPLTNFVGRRRELDELSVLIGEQRLITLAGAGGSGKTRLALETARSVKAYFPHGTLWIELAPLVDGLQVAQALARLLGVQESSDRPLSEALIEFLQNKTVLLILDNCEHVLAESARLAEQLLQGCEKLRIVATSRELLNIAGEFVYPVRTLTPPVGDDVPAVSASDAGQLFSARARSAQPAFAIRPDNAGLVAHICRRLDGMPLALELAATKLRAMDLSLLATRLDKRFDVLTSGSRTALPRQQTLRALIDWSYDLLTRDERVVLRQLAVFRGGWPLEAAEAVCELPTLPPGSEVVVAADTDIVSVLGRLVDKSLIALDQAVSPMRYSMLETIREYCQERLREAGDEDGAHNRHAYWCEQLSKAAEPHLLGAQQIHWAGILEREHANLLAALDWCIDNRDGLHALQISVYLNNFWLYKTYLIEARRILSAALALATDVPKPLHAAALSSACDFALRLGDHTLLRDYATASVALAEEVGDQNALAAAVRRLGQTHATLGDYATAEVRMRESLRRYRALNNKAYEHRVLNDLGEVYRWTRRFPQALDFYHQAIALAEVVQDARGLAYYINNVGLTLVQTRDFAGARDYLARSYELSKQTDRIVGYYVLFGLIQLAVARKAFADAARWLGALDAWSRTTGYKAYSQDAEDLESAIASTREGMDDAGFQRLWLMGQATSLESAVEGGLAHE